MLSGRLREGSQMAECKKCGAELHFDMDDTKDQVEVACPRCRARHVARWVASSPTSPGPQFILELVGEDDKGSG